MTIGVKLLDLTVEYQDSVRVRTENHGVPAAGTFTGREPSVIAADYEAAVRELLA
jgi:hypothetical protein